MSFCRQILGAALGLALAIGPMVYAPSAHAEEACTIEEAQQMLKAQTILKRAAAEASEEFLGTEAEGSNDERIAERLRSLTRELTLEYTNRQLGATESVLRFIKWRALAGYVKSASRWVKSTSRKSGIGTVIAQTSAILAEFTVPTVLVATGNPELAPFSPFVPYSIIAQGTKTLICKISHRRSMASIYGSFEDYLQTVQIERAVRREMGLHSASDWLAPIETEDGVTLNVVAGSDTAWRKFLFHSGFSHQLTYTALDDFCKELNVDSPFIRGLREDSRISGQLKLVLLLQHLSDRENSRVFLLVQEHFSEAFKSVQLSSDDSALREWVFKIAKVEDPDDLKAMVEKVPPGTTPRQVVALWKDVVLPILAERESLSGIGYFDFRRLFTNLEKLRQRAVRDAQWNEAWARYFKQYLDASILKQSCNKNLR